MILESRDDFISALERFDCEGLFLHYAVQSGSETIVGTLLESGHFKSVGVLIPHDASIEQRGRSSLTLLHKAAEKGNVKMLRLLVDRGANTDAMDDEKNTPLMTAANSGHERATAYLIERCYREPRKQRKMKFGRVLPRVLRAGVLSEYLVRQLLQEKWPRAFRSTPLFRSHVVIGIDKAIECCHEYTFILTSRYAWIVKPILDRGCRSIYLLYKKRLAWSCEQVDDTNHSTELAAMSHAGKILPTSESAIFRHSREKPSTAKGFKIEFNVVHPDIPLHFLFTGFCNNCGDLHQYRGSHDKIMSTLNGEPLASEGSWHIYESYYTKETSKAMPYELTQEDRDYLHHEGEALADPANLSWEEVDSDK